MQKAFWLLTLAPVHFRGVYPETSSEQVPGWAEPVACIFPIHVVFPIHVAQTLQSRRLQPQAMALPQPSRLLPCDLQFTAVTLEARIRAKIKRRGGKCAWELAW